MFDQILNWDHLSSIGTVLGAIGSIATAIIALFVYFEASKLRKIDGLSRSIANLQSFNSLMMQKPLADRWNAIYLGQVLWKSLDQMDKALIYSYLNIFVFEYQAAKSGMMDVRYAAKSISDNIGHFEPIWPDLVQHLRTNGWPSDFVDDLDGHMKVVAAQKPVTPAT